MEIIARDGRLAPPTTIKKKGANSKRGLILEDIAKLLGFTLTKDNYWTFAGRFNHLSGEKRVEILKSMY